MKCKHCKEILEIIDTDYEIVNSTLTYFYKGKCPSCKKEFNWVDHYPLDFEKILDFEENS